MIGELGLELAGGGTLLNTLLCLCALAVPLALDDTAVAQTWISQPLPAGILAGLVCGEPLIGLALGLPLQLVTAGNLPVGQSFVAEPVSATIAGVGALVLGYGDSALGAGVDGVHVAVIGPTQIGWMLVGVALLSLAGHWVIQAERRAHFVWMLTGHRSLRDGRQGRLERLHLRCLLTTALRGPSLTAVWLVLLLKLWVPLYVLLPERLQVTAGLLPVLVPGLAVGTLVAHFGWRSSRFWLLGGAVIASMVAVALD